VALWDARTLSRSTELPADRRPTAPSDPNGPITLIWDDPVKSACFVRCLHRLSTIVQAGEQAPLNSGARADGRSCHAQSREYAASVVAEVAIATVHHFHECGVCLVPPLFSSSEHTSIAVRPAAPAHEQGVAQAAEDQHEPNFTRRWPIDESWQLRIRRSLMAPTLLPSVPMRAASAPHTRS